MVTLYERIGGRNAVFAAVDLFYDRVLADPLLRPFFGGVDMKRQKAKQRAFLTTVFGGPSFYSGRDLARGHAHLVERGMDDRHVDAVLSHLEATLRELNVMPELIAEVRAIAESVRDDVLGRVRAD